MSEESGNHKNHRHDDDDDEGEEQLWRAFRYVSGEMSRDETSDFEVDLCSDTALCDAVAEATRLTLAVSATATSPTSGRRLVSKSKTVREPEVRSKSVMTLVVAACCCACIMAIVNVPSIPPSGSQQHLTLDAQGEADPEIVLNAWLDGAENAVETEYDSDEVITAELDVPDWMLAGVVLSVTNEDNLSVPDEG